MAPVFETDHKDTKDTKRSYGFNVPVRGLSTEFFVLFVPLCEKLGKDITRRDEGGY